MKKITYTFLICYSFNISTVSCSDFFSLSGLYNVVTTPFVLAVDVVCAPLHYFSYSSTGKSYQEAMEILEHDSLDEDKLRKSLELLDLATTENYSDALYQLGRLMLGFPEEKLEPLQRLVSFDQVQGLAYLNAAKETNPQTAYLFAEAILKPSQTIHALIVDKKMSYYKKRVEAVPLLLLAYDTIPSARDLMAELEMEDRVYEKICQMIYNDRDKEINGLKLGEAGFQESYIDSLCKDEKIASELNLTPERCFFLKMSMMRRVGIVLNFFDQYFRTGKEKANSFSGIYVNIVGKKEMEMPDPKGATTWNFTAHGLVCPVTLLDASTSYRKLIWQEDDFKTFNETDYSENK